MLNKIDLCRDRIHLLNSSMKKLFPILGLVLSLVTLAAQDTKPEAKVLKADEAKDAIGKNATVAGKVAEVNVREKVTHINLDKAFPDHPFTAVVFSTKTNLFPDLKTLMGKKVEVTGKIEEFKGKPQIVLLSTNQLKIVVEADSKADSKKSETEKSEK